MKLLMIDNYDSFTYNLVHLFEELGAEVVTVRNDAITPEDALALAPDRLVISPGPGRPEDAGVSIEMVRTLGPTTRTLGVCLGHQAIIEAFGGEVGQAKALLHGKASVVTHDGRGVYEGLPGGDRRRPLPLARRDERPGRARGDVPHRRRGGHGGPPRRASDRGRPVPSGERPHAPRSRDGEELPRRDHPRDRRHRGRAQPEPRGGARGDGRDHGRRGDAGPDRRIPDRAARQGRDGGRDRRAAQRPCASTSFPCGRPATTSSTSSEPAATEAAR